MTERSTMATGATTRGGTVDFAAVRPERADVRAFLARELTSAAGRGHDVQLVMPAPRASLDVFIALSGEQASVLWDPPRQASEEGDAAGVAGLGVARVVAPPPDEQGEPRAWAAAVRAGAEATLAALGAVRHDGAPANLTPGPRLFGGLAFAPYATAEPEWRAFGRGLFVLPRWQYTLDAERAWLSVVVDGRELDAALIESEMTRFESLWDGLAGGSEPPRTARPRPGVVLERRDRAEWEAKVSEIRDAIRAGEVEKVVAARRSVVRFDGPVDAGPVLRRLGERFDGCTRFAMWRGGAVFFGATPERLVERRGRRVFTEALAGSIGRGGAADLLASGKDREEHALVVRAIVQALRPLCSELHAARAPRIRELPNLLHMETPIEGRLSDDRHVLELVAALHPTPAVGGVPTDAAMRWIATREQAPRGWYAAPFGWFDAQGDGRFVVALRSGLIAGDHAYVYAGAGVVRDSEPAAEYDETELKMQPVLGALDAGER